MVTSQAQELRNIGDQLNKQEHALALVQEKIAHVQEKIKQRQTEGKSDAATYRRDELARLQENYASEYASYQHLREQVGGQYSAAKSAAPKDYRTDLAPDPNTGGQKIVYTGTVENGKTYTTSNLQFIFDKQTATQGSSATVDAIKPKGSVQSSQQASVNVPLGSGAPQGSVLVPRATPVNQFVSQPSGIFYTQGGQFGTGKAVLIREGGRAGQNARQTFALLGAPQRKVVGEITFGRRRSLGAEDYVSELLGKPLDLSYTEPSQVSKIYETTYAIPNAASARFAGFPVVDQSGNEIAFPARFVGTSESRQSFGKNDFLSLERQAPSISAGITRLDNYGRSKADEARASGARVGVGSALVRVQNIGRLLEGAGSSLARAGEQLEVKNPFPTTQEVEANKLLPLKEQTLGVGSEVKRNLLFRASKGAEAFGGVGESVGQALQERPLTAGLEGGSLFVGGIVGGIGEGFRLVKETGYVIEEGQAIKKSGYLANAARIIGTTGEVTTTGAGLGLGAIYVGSTGLAIKNAPDTRTAGQLAGKAGIDLASFGVGAKIGSGVVGKAGEGIQKIDSKLFLRTETFQDNKVLVQRTLRPELVPVVLSERGGEVGGRSAKQRSGKLSKAELSQRKSIQQQPFKLEREVLSRDELLYTIKGKGVERLLRQGETVPTKILKTARPEGVSVEIAQVKARQGGLPITLTREGIPEQNEFRLRRLTKDSGVPARLRKLTETPLRSEDLSLKNSIVQQRSKQVKQLLTLFKNQEEGNGQVLVQTARTKINEPITPSLLKRKKLSASSYVTSAPIRTVYSEVVVSPQDYRLGVRGGIDRRTQGALERLRVLGLKRQEQIKRQLPVPEKPYTKDVQTVFPKKSTEVVLREEVGTGQVKASSSLADSLRRSTSIDRLKRSDTRVGVALRSSQATHTAFLFDNHQVFDQTPISITGQTNIQQQEQLKDQASAQGSSNGPDNQRPTLRTKINFSDNFSDNGSNQGRRLLSTTQELPKPIFPSSIPTINRVKGPSGYLVEVKRRGKFELLSTVPLSKGQALERGALAVDTSASQTFRIREARGSAVRETSISSGSLKKFKKLDEYTYREKRGRGLIDTGGENLEITQKGLAASRAQRLRL